MKTKPPSNAVTLTVNGRIHGGWTAASIETALTSLSNAFTIEVTDGNPAKLDFAIARGDACSLAIGGTTLLTGWVDDVEIAYDGQSHGITIRGRDKTGDLVDCSALMTGTGRWDRTSVMAIAKDLLAPYGITVSSTTPDTGKVMDSHAIQMGESVWECLDRALRQYGVMAMADGNGNLVLTRPGDAGARAELRLGGTILAGQAQYSGRETFRDYYVLGQFPGSGDAYADPRVTTMASAQASDPNVKRYRPLIVFTEANTADMSFLPTRAAWEAAVRSGRGETFSVTVAGWRDSGGNLYAPNTLVRIEDDFLRVHETLLVSGVRLELGEGGQLAHLTLGRKEAFLPAPVTELPPYDPATGRTAGGAP